MYRKRKSYSRRPYRRGRYRRRKAKVSQSRFGKYADEYIRRNTHGKPGTAQSKARYGKSVKWVRNAIDYGNRATRNIARAQMVNRINDNYYGRGGYFSDLWKKGRAYLPRIGGAIGGALKGSEFGPGGMMLGADSGWNAGADFSKAIGWGDYTTTNQIVEGEPVSSQSNIHHLTEMSDLSGDVVYSNREFVTNIYATITSGASPFNVQSFALNAALSETFPFLSQIAQNFELFEFVGLLFQYKPTSGEFGSNNSNALGKVILCTNYDPDAPLFVNAIQMENYDYANSTKPSCGAVHGVECHPGQRSTTQLYTRTGVSTKDKVFTDLGLFQIATEGIPSSVAQSVLIGELWVTYTVKLSRAKLYSAVGDSVLYSLLRFGEDAATDLGARSEEVPLLVEGTIPYVSPSTVLSGKQFRFTNESTTSFYIYFGSGWQGMRLLISFYSRPTQNSGFEFDFAVVQNCSFPNGANGYWDAEQDTQRSLASVVVDFNDQFTGDAAIVVDGTIPPIANQQIWITMTVVDPQFQLPVVN